MKITFYSAPNSSAIPVTQAMLELGIEHEVITIDIINKEQPKPAEFLKHNPNGKVPTLVVDGIPLFESGAILQWIGDNFGVEKGFWPSRQSPQYLEAISWNSWAYASYVAELHRYLLASSPYVNTELHHKPTAEHAHNEIQNLFKILNDRLTDRTYILGDHYSLVDLLFGCLLGYSSMVGIDVCRQPKVQEWLKKVHAREAYQKAMYPDT